jgi:hypothetical protein
VLEKIDDQVRGMDDNILLKTLTEFNVKKFNPALFNSWETVKKKKF